MKKSIFKLSSYKLIFVVLVGLCICFFLCNDNDFRMKKSDKGVYQKKIFEASNGNLNYRIFYTENFDASKKHPLLLFMHGAGERGNDNEAQLIHGSQLVADGMNKYNAIAIFPQCPTEDYWVKFKGEDVDSNGERNFNIDVNNGPSEALGKVIELVSEMKAKNYIDKTRIYVAGLSMGGMATFDLLWRMPNTFAAAMPICGAGAPEKADKMKSVPIRIFHGEEDEVVPIQNSRDMQDALTAEGASPETFYYPGVNHDSWINAFAEKDFLSWLFDQKRVEI